MRRRDAKVAREIDHAVNNALATQHIGENVDFGEFDRLTTHLLVLTQAAVVASRLGASPLTWNDSIHKAFHLLLECNLKEKNYRFNSGLGEDYDQGLRALADYFSRETGERDTEVSVQAQRSSLALTALSRHLPMIRGLKAEQVLELREKNASYLRSFRSLVSKLSSAATANVNSSDYNSWAARVVTSEIDPLLEQLQASVDDYHHRLLSRLASSASIEKLFVPILGYALGALNIEFAIGGGMLAVLAGSLVEERLAQRSEFRRSPVSYLLKMRQAAAKHTGQR